MDIFTRFNRNNIKDRQVDTLIGLSKGLIANGNVDQLEAEFLLSWLIQNAPSCENPIIINLLEKVGGMLEDEILDEEESEELLTILHKISGEKSEIGELAKTSKLPIDTPQPSVTFQEKSFLFTGTCAFGNRTKCTEATRTLGGKVAKGVSKKLDYLVLGTYVTDSWAHETFGRKIETAMRYRDDGLPLVIITEEHWANEGGIK